MLLSPPNALPIVSGTRRAGGNISISSSRVGFYGAQSRAWKTVRCAYVREGIGFRAAPNFYEVLGLSQDVDFSRIKLAYRQMARKYHPDVCPREQLEECTQRFIALQEAYETLSDPRRRAMYDRAISGALDSHGVARTWGSNFGCQDFTPTDWRSRWTDQLSGLKNRSATKESQKPESWAARMRRKQQEESKL